LLELVLLRCAKVKSFARNVIVATSENEVDVPIREFCADRGIQCFQGSPENVANRAIDAAIFHDLDWFARINGDSPFVEPDLLEKAVSIVTHNQKLDFVTNLYPRTYPYGVAVELIRTEAYRRLYHRLGAGFETEHMTKSLYDNISQLKYVNIASEAAKISTQRFTIDTQDDLKFMQSIFDVITDPVNSSYVQAQKLADQDGADI
jgi:spore coat polysaccharide biosynthesis protein SpsF